MCMSVCVSSHAGQTDVPSYICQHSEFIYSVILSFVDLVTWSESEKCRTMDTPGGPSRTWWETRACDLTRSATHTSTCTIRPAPFTLKCLLSTKSFPYSLLLGYSQHFSLSLKVVIFCSFTFSMFLFFLYSKTTSNIIKHKRLVLSQSSPSY